MEVEAAVLAEEHTQEGQHAARPDQRRHSRKAQLDLLDEGERAAARDLSAKGICPVLQSYRSLGPADLSKVPYWLWSSAREAGKRRRFDDEGSTSAVWKLLAR